MEKTILKTSSSVYDKKTKTTWIILIFKTSFIVYNIRSVVFLKKFKQSFFGIFSIKIANQ